MAFILGLVTAPYGYLCRTLRLKTGSFEVKTHGRRPKWVQRYVAAHFSFKLGTFILGVNINNAILHFSEQFMVQYSVSNSLFLLLFWGFRAFLQTTCPWARP